MDGLMFFIQIPRGSLYRRFQGSFGGQILHAVLTSLPWPQSVVAWHASVATSQHYTPEHLFTFKIPCRKPRTNQATEYNAVEPSIRVTVQSTINSQFRTFFSAQFCDLHCRRLPLKKASVESYCSQGMTRCPSSRQTTYFVRLDEELLPLSHQKPRLFRPNQTSRNPPTLRWIHGRK